MYFRNEIGRLIAASLLLASYTTAFVPSGKKVGWNNAPLNTPSLINDERLVTLKYHLQQFTIMRKV